MNGVIIIVLILNWLCIIALSFLKRDILLSHTEEHCHGVLGRRNDRDVDVDCSVQNEDFLKCLLHLRPYDCFFYASFIQIVLVYSLLVAIGHCIDRTNS